MKYLMLMLMLFSAINEGIAQTAREMQLSANVSESGCAGTNHTVAVEAHGGKAPYTYSWSDGGSGAFRNNLMGGTYTCTVSDSSGKIAKKSFQLAKLPTELTANAEQKKAGDKTVVQIQASGGTAPYSYTWFGRGLKPVATKELAQTLSAGNYQVVVQDANGCSTSVSLSLK